MEGFTAGTLAGTGSFRCEQCDFAVALHELDEIPVCPRCGGRRFRRSSMFEARTAFEPPPSAGRPPGWLLDARASLEAGGDYLIFEAAGRVQVVNLQEGWTRVGRSPSAAIRLDDPTVSRRHALVHRDDAGTKALDDRSLNGMFVNGEKVETRALEDGDELGIGRFRLFFVAAPGDRDGDRESAGAQVC